MYPCTKCILDPMCIKACGKFYIKKFSPQQYFMNVTRVRRLMDKYKNTGISFYYKKYAIEICGHHIDIEPKKGAMEWPKPTYRSVWIQMSDDDDHIELRLKIIKNKLKNLGRVVECLR